MTDCRSKDESCADRLLARLEQRGYKARIVPVSRLQQLREDLEKQRRMGTLEKGFDEERLSLFDFNVTDRHPNIRSIIITAARQPHVRLTVAFDGHTMPLMVPPTYSTEIDDEIESTVLTVLSPAGYKLYQWSLPKKLLAVHSGLARYGRNNITYVDGMGSYCRLVAFYSDMHCPEGEWLELAQMDLCQSCRACLDACPTGAISESRFLLHAEQCLTYINECAGPFPASVDQSWHHCLFGCLDCQTSCPENRKLPLWVEEGYSFTEAETEFLLKGSEAGDIPEVTQRKIAQFDFVQDRDELARNLQVLIENCGQVESKLKRIYRDYI